MNIISWKDGCICHIEIYLTIEDIQRIFRENAVRKFTKILCLGNTEFTIRRLEDAISERTESEDQKRLLG